MSILLFDYECPVCETIEEHMVSIHDEVVHCKKCGSPMTKVFLSAGSRLPDDATWLKSVTEVVSKDPSKPHAREFLRNPTRENYKNWMKSEGIRPLERGEHEHGKRRRQELEAEGHKRRVDFMAKRRAERNRIVVGGY